MEKGYKNRPISTPVERIDARPKIRGTAEYVDDRTIPGMIYAKNFVSTIAKGKIESVRIPELPDGYTVIDKNDIPGRNRVKMIADDWPFLAEDTVSHFGEPILIVAGPDRAEIDKILSEIRVEYIPSDAVFTMEDAEIKNSTFVDYSIKKGEPAAAESEASRVIEDTYSTGIQEHIYLEPQGVIAEYRDGKITVYGSMQCPYYVKGALVQAFGFDEDRIRVIQTTTGGAFGGKEDYPSLISFYAALASYRTGKPVKMIFNRLEDIVTTTKRHPSKIHIKTFLDSSGGITGMDIDIKLDGGAYEGLSSVVLQRSIFAATGVYNIPNVRVRGRAFRTNNVPKGAFRGFGGPQAVFAIEMHMNRIAVEMEKDPAMFKSKYLLKEGDYTITGGKLRGEIKLPEMLKKAFSLSGYREKYRKYSVVNGGGSAYEGNVTGRDSKGVFEKRKGIGISVFNHGCGFTGSGEKEKIKGRVKLKLLADGRAEMLVSSTEMGQGAQTTLRKIVSDTLNIPPEKVIYDNPDTDRVPDSGPTVASRTAMIVGGIVLRAAIKLKEKLAEKMSVLRETGKSIHEEITVEEQYRQPEEIEWDQDSFHGNAYPDYAWGVNVVEVEVDMLTLEVVPTGIWGVFDIGMPLDEKIAEGQMCGGIAQGIGWAGMEVMTEENGRIRQASVTDYIIPTARDLPEIKVAFVNSASPYGPYGAKGAGELPLVGAAPAYAAAVQNALGRPVNRIPITPDYLMNL